MLSPSIEYEQCKHQKRRRPLRLPALQPGYIFEAERFVARDIDLRKGDYRTMPEM